MEQKDLQMFKFQDKQVRIVLKGPDPWWVGKDVCDVLGYANSRDAIEKHCKHASLLKSSETLLLDMPSRGLIIIPESDVYRLIIRSNLPDAEHFEAWVMQEVLPSIRRHGTYMTPQKIEEILSNPDTIIELAQSLKKEQAKTREFATKIEADYPKVLFADSVASSKTSILIGDFAKILRQNKIEMGQNRLFQWLRENEYLISRKGDSLNMPTQYSMENGWFEIKERVINSPDGSIRTTKTTKMTGKGQVYFLNLFLNKTNKSK